MYSFTYYLYSHSLVVSVFMYLFFHLLACTLYCSDVYVESRVRLLACVNIFRQVSWFWFWLKIPLQTWNDISFLSPHWKIQNLWICRYVDTFQKVWLLNTSLLLHWKLNFHRMCTEGFKCPHTICVCCILDRDYSSQTSCDVTKSFNSKFSMSTEKRTLFSR